MSRRLDVECGKYQQMPTVPTVQYSTNSTNVVSTNRCLSAVCSISGALSLPALSTSARHLDQTDIFFCLEMLMDHTSCPPVQVHLVESENVTKDNFSPVIERSGKHLRPDGAGAPILANLTHGSHSWPRESGKFQPVLQFYSGWYSSQSYWRNLPPFKMEDTLNWN